MLDLAVLGGGPAGTAAALEARRRGLSVAVWERDRFPRDKVCGEFVSAESLPVLGVEIPEALRLASFITHAEFFSPGGRALGFELPAAARGLSRRVLDQAMWRAAGRAGATMYEGQAVRRVHLLRQQRDAAWVIESEEGAAMRARALIVACGRWWRIDGFESPAREARETAVGPWLGVKAHFLGIAPRRAVEMFYFEGGYCGLAPVEDGVYNACCLVHPGAARRDSAGAAKDFAAWIGAVARHAALGARLKGATQQGETVTTAPVRPARRRATTGEAIFAGDAAGFLDPFTGDGISMALHSGRLAAEVVADNLARAVPDALAAARGYQSRLNLSVRRSYALAGLLRTLVRAPGAVQDGAAAVIIPWLGARLHAGTRWRPSRESNAGRTRLNSSTMQRMKE